jgi:hypothetical protein
LFYERNVSSQAVELIVVVWIVVLGSPKMYMHMVKTRKKQFAERKKELQAKEA